MKTITFYENKYEDNHLMLCGIYVGKAVKNLCLSVVDALHFLKRLIRRYPFCSIIRCRLHGGDMQLCGDWQGKSRKG